MIFLDQVELDLAIDFLRNIDVFLLCFFLNNFRFLVLNGDPEIRVVSEPSPEVALQEFIQKYCTHKHREQSVELGVHCRSFWRLIFWPQGKNTEGIHGVKEVENEKSLCCLLFEFMLISEVHLLDESSRHSSVDFFVENSNHSKRHTFNTRNQILKCVLCDSLCRHRLIVHLWWSFNQIHSSCDRSQHEKAEKEVSGLGKGTITGGSLGPDIGVRIVHAHVVELLSLCTLVSILENP
jgi:hypothetical protein